MVQRVLTSPDLGEHNTMLHGVAVGKNVMELVWFAFDEVE